MNTGRRPVPSCCTNQKKTAMLTSVRRTATTAKKLIAFTISAAARPAAVRKLPPVTEAPHQRDGVAAHGALWAMDLRTGKVVGKAQFPVLTESGMLGTDGDLLFTGHPNGRLAAYDADTLKEVWSFSVGMPITAPPMTYSVGGKQYVAVSAGSALFVYGLRE